MNTSRIRGIPLNLATGGVSDPNIGRQRIPRSNARKRNWHVQMFHQPRHIAPIRDLVAASPVPVVFDHFGGAKGRARSGERAGLCRSACAGTNPARPTSKISRRLSSTLAPHYTYASAGADRGECDRTGRSESTTLPRKPLRRRPDRRRAAQQLAVRGARRLQPNPGRQSGPGSMDFERRSPAPRGGTNIPRRTCEARRSRRTEHVEAFYRRRHRRRRLQAAHDISGPVSVKPAAGGRSGPRSERIELRYQRAQTLTSSDCRGSGQTDDHLKAARLQFDPAGSAGFRTEIAS